MIRIVMRHLDIVTFATQTIQLRWIIINAWQNACLLSIYVTRIRISKITNANNAGLKWPFPAFPREVCRQCE